MFGRSGHNLTITVPVTFTEAALGAEIKVPSHRGMPVNLRIPPGTPNGRTFRVRGKGVRRSDGTQGDLLVKVDVQVPTELTDDGPRGPGEVQGRDHGRGPAGRAAAQGPDVMLDGNRRVPGARVCEGDDMPNDFELTDDTPVYVISVAAQLSGLHPQTLRAYDRLGLVSPGRAAGRGRRYSLRDILILREVQRLSQEDGVNLSGIKRILELESEWQRSRTMLAEMHAEISQLRAELESTRAVAARLAALLRTRTGGGALVPVRRAGQPDRAMPRCRKGASSGGRQAHPQEPGGAERRASARVGRGQPERRRAAPARRAARPGRRHRRPAAPGGRRGPGRDREPDQRAARPAAAGGGRHR